MKILMVDDSDVMRQMVRFTLESAGQHSCVEAADGQEALERLNEHQVDLIITDLNMPRMNGIELTKALREMPEYRYAPIIMLTTEKSESLKQQGEKVMVSSWLNKPFNPEKLLHLISKYNQEQVSA